MALNKPATQSTTCRGLEGEAPSAVDGDNTTEFGEIKPFACTCSGGGQKFWRVDLGQKYQLWKINIYQRNSCNYHK